MVMAGNQQSILSPEPQSVNVNDHGHGNRGWNSQSSDDDGAIPPSSIMLRRTPLPGSSQVSQSQRIGASWVGSAALRIITRWYTRNRLWNAQRRAQRAVPRNPNT